VSVDLSADRFFYRSPAPCLDYFCAVGVSPEPPRPAIGKGPRVRPSARSGPRQEFHRSPGGTPYGVYTMFRLRPPTVLRGHNPKDLDQRRRRMKDAMTTMTKLQKITRLSVGAIAAGLMMTGGATPASATPTPTQSTGVAASAQQPGLMLPAACAQWSIALLRIQQSNGWQMFIYRDAQKGSEIRGNARADEMRGGGILIGDVEGSVRGNVVDFTASWTNGSFGRYVGSIDNDGFTSGTTRDKAYKVTATWRLLRRAMCVQR
jgi:hypothetical protein